MLIKNKNVQLKLYMQGNNCYIKIILESLGSIEKVRSSKLCYFYNYIVFEPNYVIDVHYYSPNKINVLTFLEIL